MTPRFPSQLPAERHWVIGDVHGCAAALHNLLAELPTDDRLVFVGDIINRGPRVEEAMEITWDLVESGRAVWLMGNHEQDLLTSLAMDDGPAGPALVGSDTFLQLGGNRCRRWRERLESLPLAFWGDGWVATHAGFDPIRWEPDLRVRMTFWQSYDGRFGDVVVGHTPGPEVRRLGRIVLIDTGACYGGRLTAYCPETREVRSVGGLPALPGACSARQVAPRGCLL